MRWRASRPQLKRDPLDSANYSMPGIRIRDLDGTSLAFDLRELLHVLGPEALSSSWKCVVEQYVPADSARPNLADEYENSSGVDGAALVALAAETRQVIDGRFEAFRRSEIEPWLRLEAIDSTYWEIFATNADDLTRFRRKFRNIEDL